MSENRMSMLWLPPSKTNDRTMAAVESLWHLPMVQLLNLAVLHLMAFYGQMLNSPVT